jgi:hypothetical protein
MEAGKTYKLWLVPALLGEYGRYVLPDLVLDFEVFDACLETAHAGRVPFVEFGALMRFVACSVPCSVFVEIFEAEPVRPYAPRHSHDCLWKRIET